VGEPRHRLPAGDGSRPPFGLNDRGVAQGPLPKSRTTEQSHEFNRTYKAGYRDQDHLWSGYCIFISGCARRQDGAEATFQNSTRASPGWPPSVITMTWNWLPWKPPAVTNSGLSRSFQNRT